MQEWDGSNPKILKRVYDIMDAAKLPVELLLDSPMNKKNINLKSVNPIKFLSVEYNYFFFSEIRFMRTRLQWAT